MAKKKDDDLKSIVLELIKEQVFKSIKDQITKLNDTVQNALEVTQKKIVRTIISVILVLMSVLFLIVGSTFYITDVIGISRTAVYLIIGIILLLVWIIYGQSAKNLRYEF